LKEDRYIENIKETRGTYGAGTTYIDKKSGRWIAQVYAATADEKNKKRITGYGETEAKAVRDRNKKVKVFQEQQQTLKEQLQFKQEHVETLQDYTEKWLNTTCKHNVKITTYENYCYFFYTHIKSSRLGEIQMDLIKDADLIKYYYEKLENGRSDGRGGLSERSVNYLGFLIKGSLTRAHNKGMIHVNPHAEIKRVKDNTAEEEDKDIHPLQLDEMESFKEALAGNINKFNYLFLFTLGTGIRKGEASALTWDDVDLEQKLIYVRKNLAYIKDGEAHVEEINRKKAFVTSTKTRSSKRTMHINDSLIECLIKQKELQEKDKILLKDLYDDKGLIFAAETGNYLSPRKILSEVKKVYKHAGISTTHTFHDLRHTFCSILISRNVNVKTISELMGHSSITITLDIYANIYEEMKAKAMDSAADILNIAI